MRTSVAGTCEIVETVDDERLDRGVPLDPADLVGHLTGPDGTDDVPGSVDQSRRPVPQPQRVDDPHSHAGSREVVGVLVDDARPASGEARQARRHEGDVAQLRHVTSSPRDRHCAGRRAPWRAGRRIATCARLAP